MALMTCDRTVFIGLDLGQRGSHTAIVALDRVDEAPDYTDMLRGMGMKRRFVVRAAERVALGMPYPAVVNRVKAIVGQLLVRGSCILVVDGTGVGVPVVDLMREVGMGCRVIPIVITSGQHATAGSVPRAELVTKMQVMAQRGELEIAGGCGYLEELKRELLHLQLMGAGGSGRGCGARESDDLALALALACWRAKVR
jgi:hypothetical protein